MFFTDQRQAIREMWRVLRPGGHLVAAVWDKVENAPGYAAVITMLDRLFGRAMGDLLRAPYSLCDPEALHALFDSAGVTGANVSRAPGDARFPSIRSWAHTDVRGWTLADKLDDAQFDRFAAEAQVELQRFVTAAGTVQFPHPALIVTATKH
jgi:SAM-dependent methyltransferase